MSCKSKLAAFIVLFSMLVSSVAFAHNMPREEMYVGGVGPGCTLGYVKEIYGEPIDKIESTTDWLHIVTYKYSESFSITGRSFAEENIPENEMMVAGFVLKDNSLSTPSGIRVGSPYEEVIHKFGYGDEVKLSGNTYYCFNAPNSAVEMSFGVNDDYIITEIRAGTEL